MDDHLDKPVADGRAALPPRLNLGGALRRWRVLNSLSQDALAQHLGVSQVTVSRWEKGYAPAPTHEKTIRALIEAQPTTASDHALARLIETSSEPYFLICDISHNLLAASHRRALEWHQSVSDLVGTCFWRFATEEIDQVERELDPSGWFDHPHSERHFFTSSADYDEIKIVEGERKVVRLPLSDGRFARLVNDH
ncbi:MAG: helix-turn-helix transcriptional regulator [Pseudomonadota bacterium]